MTDDTYPSFEDLCRLCLRPGTATVDIFSNNICGSNKEPSVPVRIMACAALEVQPTDGLPKSVCTECRYQLEKSYYFRKRCQLSDKKLRKHQRLLSLGKKSKVFSRTEEEDFEDELEFEDSRIFLDEKDSERQRQEQERNDCWKVWTKEMLREEVIREYKERLMSECKDQIRAEVEDELMEEMLMRAQEEVRPKLKKEVREEVKAELREEVTQSIREEVTQSIRESLKLEMREECIAQAMVDLRIECRKEERENLLNDLRDFLCLKRNNNGKYEKVEKSINSNDSVVNLSAVATISQENETKLEASPYINKKRSLTNSPMPLRATQKLKMSVEKESNSSDNEITSTEQTISFIAITNDQQSQEAAESNFLILENEERGNEDEENLLYSYSDEDEFQITPSECSVNCNATYQIEASGEVKFFKKEHLRGMDNNSETASGGDPATEEEDIDKNILIFDPQVEQGDSLEKVEFVNLEKKSGSTSKKNVFEPNKVINSFPKDISISKQNSATVMLNSKDIVKTFQCSQCPRAFTTENSMRRHMAVHRILEKKGVIYKCSDCQIIVSCKSALNRHMLKHSGERPYVCEECGKSFIQREILKRHILAHAGARPYGCPHCDRSFSQKLNLTQHVNKFHTENPKIQQYPCHLCPKRFNHASGLSRHLIKHSGVAYQCTECDRTFTDRSSVKRHIVHLHGGNGIDRIETMSINEEISKGDRISLNQKHTRIQKSISLGVFGLQNSVFNDKNGDFKIQELRKP